MRTYLFALVFVTVTILLPGCAGGFRAGTNRGGVDAGVAIQPPPPIVVSPALEQ